MRLNVSSSASSTSVSFSSTDFRAQYSARPVSAFIGGFIVSSGIVFGRHVYGARSGASWKQPRIGVADRSSWFIGGSPRISSIVLTMPVWL